MSKEMKSGQLKVDGYTPLPPAESVEGRALSLSLSVSIALALSLSLSLALSLSPVLLEACAPVSQGCCREEGFILLVQS